MAEKSLFELLKKIIEKSTLTAVSATSSGGEITLSNGVITQVQINTLAVARGVDSDFTLSNGGVKCNFDGYIEVCGSVYVSAGSGTYAKGCYIYKNSAEVTSMLLGSDSGGRSVAPKIISVSSGDIIYLKGRSNNSGSKLYPNNSATYLTIKRIN